MTISEQPTETVLGKVVAIYRQCENCEDWKPREHFLKLSGGRRTRVTASSHVCAACRARGFAPSKQD